MGERGPTLGLALEHQQSVVGGHRLVAGKPQAPRLGHGDQPYRVANAHRWVQRPQLGIKRRIARGGVPASVLKRSVDQQQVPSAQHRGAAAQQVWH